LGPYYIALAVMNGLAALYLWRTERLSTWFSIPLPGTGKSIPVTNAVIWLIVSALFAILAAIAGQGIAGAASLPASWREAINQSTGPVLYSVGTTVALIVLYIFRAFFVRPAVAWTIWNLMWLFLGLSMTDRNFYE